MPEAKTANPIKDAIADTLFIPLYAKAVESGRRAPLISDPWACDMVDKIDYDFSKYDGYVRTSVGVALRATYNDGIAAQFINRHPEAVIVHLGCGLDTRYQRLGDSVTAKAVFYELDLPEVMDFRAEMLPETENDIYLSKSLFETDWMDELVAKHPQGPFLFIAEGVLMYFEKNQVKEFMLNLAQRFSNSNILFDVVSDWMRRNSHRHETVKLTNALFKLGVDDDREIEQWSNKFKLISAKRFSDLKDWRRTGFVNYWIMKLVPPIRNASRMLYYRID